MLNLVFLLYVTYKCDVRCRGHPNPVRSGSGWLIVLIWSKNFFFSCLFKALPVLSPEDGCPVSSTSDDPRKELPSYGYRIRKCWERPQTQFKLQLLKFYFKLRLFSVYVVRFGTEAQVEGKVTLKGKGHTWLLQTCFCGYERASGSFAFLESLVLS